MSLWSPGSAGSDNNEQLVLLLVGLFFFSVVVMPNLPIWIATVNTWLLDNRVLIPDHYAVLTIPGLTGGLDLRRIFIAALLIIGTLSAIKAGRPRAAHA